MEAKVAEKRKFSVLDPNADNVTKEHVLRCKRSVVRVYGLGPKTTITITLNGTSVEARICIPGDCFVLSYEEVVNLYEGVSKWPHPKTGPHVTLSITTIDDLGALGCRIVASAEGLRFERHAIIPSNPMDPDDLISCQLELDIEASSKLISTLNNISTHVKLLKDNEKGIETMYGVICETYISQYHECAMLLPMDSVYADLTRIVSSVVPTRKILNEFSKRLQNKNIVCVLSHMSLFSVCRGQYLFIQELLSDMI